jgi:sugar lactone lactonase YvrE
VVARTQQAPDGLVADEFGRIYIADNGSGSVRRFDPETGEVVVIAEGLTAVASLVFGEGEFDRYSLYATSTARGGGKIWRIPVGVRGARPLR